MELKHRKAVVYIVIIVLQILVFFYWGTRKTNYYIDDFYSMGYASNFTGQGDTAKYITTSPEFQLNQWINNSDLKKYLFLSEEEKLFSTYHFPILRWQKNRSCIPKLIGNQSRN